VVRMGYDRHKFHGKLAHLPQDKIAAVINALVERRYLALTGDKLPVLTLTPSGQAALQARAAIPLPVRAPGPADPAVRKWRSQAKRSDTVAQTLALYRQGLAPAQIAQERGLSVRTVYEHVAHLIAGGEIELERVVAAEVIAQVRAVAQEIGAERLAPLKQLLPDSISYGEIRCVVAALGATGKAGAVEPKAEPPIAPPDPVATILSAVADLPGQLNRSGLAKLLTGSPSERVAPFRDHPLYGTLYAGWGRQELTEEIDRLIAQGWLLLQRERLSLSPAGQAHLQELS